MAAEEAAERTRGPRDSRDGDTEVYIFDALIEYSVRKKQTNRKNKKNQNKNNKNKNNGDKDNKNKEQQCEKK